jgi:hypothetical protein
MATFHCHARSGKACKGAGARHCDYILGEGKYADKSEVVYCEHGNLPVFANCGKRFFALADQNERSNGRSYRGLTIAIPVEAADPVAWSRQLVHAIAGDQAFSFSVHLKERNPHLHLMLSERTNSRNLPPQKYFSRANKKIRAYTEKSWLKKVKAKYLEHIRTVAPTYTPAMAGGRERQFSPSQPDKIAGAQAERILPKLLELAKAFQAKEGRHIKQEEHKMTNEKSKAKNTELLKAPEAAPVEDLSAIYGCDVEEWGGIENADPRPADDTAYQYRLAQQKYEGFRIRGLTYCRMGNPKYVVLWFADKSKIIDSGNTLTASAGTAKENAQRLIELARLKKWQSVRLSGSVAFVEAAMRSADAAGLEVSPGDEAQRRLWERIQAEATPTTEQVMANADTAHVVPTLAGLGERLGRREAKALTPKRGRGLGL